MRYFLFLVSFVFVISRAQAVSKIEAKCAGYKLPNGLALSFNYVTDPQSNGTSKPEIQAYEQNSKLPNAPIQYLGPERCDSVRVENGKTICMTELSEIYTLDATSRSATEAGDGYSAKYKCEFF